MTWTLPTRTGEYAVAAAPAGAGLVCVGWGPEAGSLPVPEITGSTYESPIELLPLEATALGTRSVHGSEIVARRSDGLRGARLTAGETSVSTQGAEALLTCALSDPLLGLSVTLEIRTSVLHDAVRKRAVIRNDSTLPIELLRAWGGAFVVPRAANAGASVDVLGGGHCREFQPFRADLGAGTLSIGSRQGITSRTYAPVVTLHAGGALFGVAVAWSGSWRLAVDAVPLGDHVRVAAGLDDEAGILTLAPGETITTPELVGIRTDGDGDDLAQEWHRYEATLARPHDAATRPVLYNSWESTLFDVRAEHQLALADVAADLGAELFVIDDGWFRGRTSDRAGLGDWEPDPQRLPGGLAPLIRGVHERGMRFGLWVEPESVNPDSDLYRAHPEWTHQAQGRPLTPRRNQYLLDLGLPEVEEWVVATLRRLLGENDIAYLKWDMNRWVTDGGQTVPGGDDWSWRHTRAYHRVLDTLREEFPHVIVEACAGGGGRIDLAVLERSDVVWPSDETAPRERLALQHGFLGVYPASIMSSWVTDKRDPRDPDPSSLAFRFVVAMAGVLGIGADVLAWSGDERALAASFVELYKRIRPVVHGGVVRRHGSPSDEACAVQYTLGDRIVVLAWRRPGGALDVALRDVPAGSRWRVAGSGSIVDRTLTLGWAWDDCDVVELERVS